MRIIRIWEIWAVSPLSHKPRIYVNPKIKNKTLYNRYSGMVKLAQPNANDSHLRLAWSPCHPNFETKKPPNWTALNAYFPLENLSYQ